MQPLHLTPRQLARIMKALSNENRLELYLEIARNQVSQFAEEECCIHDIVKKFNLSPPTISHHLKELADAGLIETERRGKYVTATINRQTAASVTRFLENVEHKP